MDKAQLVALLQAVREGRVLPDDAAERLSALPYYEDLSFAKVDHHRAWRKGFPEVVFGETKTPQQVLRIIESLDHRGSPILVTRASQELADAVMAAYPRACYNLAARTLLLTGAQEELKDGVVVVSAGTGDIPVAEEAAITAQALGSVVERIDDVGVAGLHRLLSHQDKLRQAHVVVAVAGMDGVLPTVLAGLVEAPVIAVPTSIGYGTGLGGASALLTMLNSCAPGVAVVNIDNGFGAGYLAGLINRIWHQGGRDHR